MENTLVANQNQKEKVINYEQLCSETKILDENGLPRLMYNRSHNNFEEFELGKRNPALPKQGVNKFGFFFSSDKDLTHYGSYVKERYLNIKKPFYMDDLGISTNYDTLRKKLIEHGFSDKELAGFDRQVQDLNIARNKALGYRNFYINYEGKNMYEADMLTFKFLDAGEGFYLRKLLESKGFDGVVFTDEGDFTAVAFYPEQIISL